MGKFDALLASSKAQFSVFGEDPRVEALCSKYSQSFTFKPFDSWKLAKTFSRIRENLDKKRGRFRVPEFFSEHYIYLQLLKFESVLLVSQVSQLEPENLIWIDAGLHSHLLPETWQKKWNEPDKIHALQIGPIVWEGWVLETPTVSIAGGCWGGSRKAMQLLCTRVLDLHEETLQKGQVGNDQQYLSIIFKRFPADFLVKRSYTQILPLYSTQNYNRIVDSVLDESEPEKFKSYLIIFMGVLYFFFFFLISLVAS